MCIISFEYACLHITTRQNPDCFWNEVLASVKIPRLCSDCKPEDKERNLSFEDKKTQSLIQEHKATESKRAVKEVDEMFANIEAARTERAGWDGVAGSVGGSGRGNLSLEEREAQSVIQEHKATESKTAETEANKMFADIEKARENSAGWDGLAGS